MDLNEIKNRAKDLLSDLTEPRPERDDPKDQDQDQARVDDPAARTDRLNTTTGEPVVDHRDEHLDPSSPPARGPEHVVVPEPPVAHGDGPTAAPTVVHRDEPGDEPSAEPAVEEWDDGVDRPASAGMPEHRVLAQTREPAPPAAAAPLEPVQPGVADTAAVPATDPGPVDDGRHHLREPHEQGSAGTGETVAAAAESAGVSRTESTPGDPERLVTAERAQSYGSRWDEVKGEFVDEPRQAVAKADALVGELLDELGQLFTRQRREIEQDLDNNDASTEDLRVALRRYRSFFDRLLSV